MDLRDLGNTLLVEDAIRIADHVVDGDPGTAFGVQATERTCADGGFQFFGCAGAPAPGPRGSFLFDMQRSMNFLRSAP